MFVHGIQDAQKTWTKTLPSPLDNQINQVLRIGFGRRRGTAERIEDGRSVFWPRDLLPQKIKNIRVLSYDYDSNCVGFIQGSNKNGIYQHAEHMLSALQRIRIDVRLPTEHTKKFLLLI